MYIPGNLSILSRSLSISISVSGALFCWLVGFILIANTQLSSYQSKYFQIRYCVTAGCSNGTVFIIGESLNVYLFNSILDTEGSTQHTSLGHPMNRLMLPATGASE